MTTPPIFNRLRALFLAALRIWTSAPGCSGNCNGGRLPCNCKQNFNGEMMEQNKETDLQQLKALALAAPGPWRGDRYDGTVKYEVLSANGSTVILGNNSEFGIQDEADEKFILAANPAVVLDLIARIERADAAKSRAYENGVEDGRGMASSIDRAASPATASGDELPVKAGDKVIEGGVTQTLSENGATVYNALKAAGQPVAKIQARAAVSAATKPTAEIKPSFHVIVDGKGIAEYVTMTAREAQEHISDACVEGVEGAGKWRAVPVSIAEQWTKGSVEKLSRELAEAVAKNASTVPQLTFPHIYLGLCDALIGSAEVADVQSLLATKPAQDERDTLAAAIASAAEARGIIKPGASLTGPQLVMLCSDLATKPAAQAVPEHHLSVMEEAAQVLESAAAHNRMKNRTVLAHSQQGRADRLREAIAFVAAPAAPMAQEQVKAESDAVIEAREQALIEAEHICDLKYEARVNSGHPREASTARALAEEIRALRTPASGTEGAA